MLNSKSFYSHIVEASVGSVLLISLLTLRFIRPRKRIMRLKNMVINDFSDLITNYKLYDLFMLVSWETLLFFIIHDIYVDF